MDIIDLDLESLKLGLLSSDRFWNKKLIIFNTASQCGFTKQLADFQKIYEEGRAVPIAVPTNNFGNQEPGDDYEIIQFAKNRYGITFPICKKTDTGHKFFQTFGTPDWNFNKYLFNEKHEFVKQFNAYTLPMDVLNA
jgi:glutathione peroxidase